MKFQFSLMTLVVMIVYSGVFLWLNLHFGRIDLIKPEKYYVESRGWPVRLRTIIDNTGDETEGRSLWDGYALQRAQQIAGSFFSEKYIVCNAFVFIIGITILYILSENLLKVIERGKSGTGKSGTVLSKNEP